MARLVRKDVFDAGQNALIDRLLARCPAIIACSPAVPDEILGWVCREFDPSGVVHFTYVKHAYRRFGIGSFLCFGATRFSHQTQAGDSVARKLGALFDPFSLSQE